MFAVIKRNDFYKPIFFHNSLAKTIIIEEVVQAKRCDGGVKPVRLFFEIDNTAFSHPVRCKLRLHYARLIADGIVDLRDKFTLRPSLTTPSFRIPCGAASITGLLGSSTRPEEVDIVVDRPFLFFVQEQSTGAILFIGKVGKI